jgi:16S rRNA (uracil1498-N3)-methyltransferase
LDWSIEKSTETGAGFFLLLQAAGSTTWSGKDASARLARWSRIAQEAAKQSKQPAVPSVEVVASSAAALDRLNSWGVVSLLLDPDAEQTLFEVLRVWADGLGFPLAAGAPGVAGSAATEQAVEDSAALGRGGVALWVGPEGGWTGEERKRLLDAGLVAVRLGRGVLRMETAGPVAMAVARLALGDW